MIEEVSLAGFFSSSKKCDYEMLISMKEFDSGDAIQKENKIMAEFMCPVCKKIDWNKELQQLLEFDKRASFDIAGDIITYACNTCDKEIVLKFVFVKEDE